MRYRVESIHIPSYRGAASSTDEARLIPGRRIVHVFSSSQPLPGGGVELQVLTEEDEVPGNPSGAA